MTWGSTSYGGGAGSGGFTDNGFGASGVPDAVQPVDPSGALEMRTGDDVVHASFGDGVVTGTEPGGVIVVRFVDGKERKLMADYAPIKRK